MAKHKTHYEDCDILVVGGSAHKFSSGSFTEGRLAAKAAVKYIEDKKADGIKVSSKSVKMPLKNVFFLNQI